MLLELDISSLLQDTVETDFLSRHQNLLHRNGFSHLQSCLCTLCHNDFHHIQVFLSSIFLPIAKVPGRNLAALIFLNQFYCDVVKYGTYAKEIKRYRRIWYQSYLPEACTKLIHLSWSNHSHQSVRTLRGRPKFHGQALPNRGQECGETLLGHWDVWKLWDDFWCYKPRLSSNEARSAQTLPMIFVCNFSTPNSRPC